MYKGIRKYANSIFTNNTVVTQSKTPIHRLPSPTPLSLTLTHSIKFRRAINNFVVNLSTA